MALPKNFQQTVNLTNRIESLNDIIFYYFEYTVNLSDGYEKHLVDENGVKLELEDFLGEITPCGNGRLNGVNRVYALTTEQATKKLDKWLQSSIDKGLITDYVINKCVEKTFNDEVLEFYGDLLKN